MHFISAATITTVLALVNLGLANINVDIAVRGADEASVGQYHLRSPLKMSRIVQGGKAMDCCFPDCDEEYGCRCDDGTAATPYCGYGRE